MSIMKACVLLASLQLTWAMQTGSVKALLATEQKKQELLIGSKGELKEIQHTDTVQSTGGSTMEFHSDGHMTSLEHHPAKAEPKSLVQSGSDALVENSVVKTREEIAQRFCQHCYFQGHLTQIQMKKCHRTDLWRNQQDITLTTDRRRTPAGGGTCWSPSYSPNSPNANYIVFDAKKMEGEASLCRCFLNLVTQCYNKYKELGYEKRTQCAKEKICDCASMCSGFKEESVGCDAGLMETNTLLQRANHVANGSSIDESLTMKKTC